MKTKKLKLKVIELPEFVGKTLQEAYDYLHKTYPNQLPDEKVKDMVYNGELELPKDDSVWYFFFGSLVRHSGGNANVPYVHWDGSEWRRSADWLDSDWDSDYRVVLLETLPVDLDSVPLDFESLALKLENIHNELGEIIKKLK